MSLILNWLQHKQASNAAKTAEREKRELMRMLSDFADRVMHFEGRTWNLPPSEPLSLPPEDEQPDTEWLPFS